VPDFGLMGLRKLRPRNDAVAKNNLLFVAQALLPVIFLPNTNYQILSTETGGMNAAETQKLIASC